MSLRYSLASIALALATVLAAQTQQTLKGTLTDAQSELPLIGATVEVLGVEDGPEGARLGTTTDLDGRYALTVPVGTHTVRASYLGYAAATVPNVRVVAGKEAVLDLPLTESVAELGEVVVTADQRSVGEPVNELAAVSARAVDVAQVNRFAGGRSDISRLASNFAGVATADDSRNDIVVRGNSPTGLLWQLEGVPIPNPNHFSTLGTTGGPVSALNPNLLATSDFLTSAFPAEYGNALSGVFDLSLRRGNRDRYEYTAQIGSFSGVEVMAEGPVNNSGGSFVAGFRNSFVGLASELGIPVGTNATPDYRDLTFKVDLPTERAGNFSVFGIGGTSRIDFIGAELDTTDLFADPAEDAFPRSRFGVLGARHNLIVGDAAYVRTTLAASYAGNRYTQFNTVEGVGRLQFTDVRDDNLTLSLKSYYNRKLSARATLRAGLQLDRTTTDSRVVNRDENPDRDDDGIPDLAVERDFDDAFALAQAYAQGKYRFSGSVTASLGLHALYSELADQISLEPRASLAYAPADDWDLTLGYGLHSQQAPLPVLFAREELPDGTVRDNAGLGLTRSHQTVLAVEHRPAPGWRLRSEAYAQWLFDVPVEPAPSTYSTLNVGADFVFPLRTALVNEGTGTNVGVELTAERQLAGGFYALATGSLYRSRYEGSDGVERPTAFDNGYVANVLGGREWAFGKADGAGARNKAFTVDVKLTAAGGRPFTPVDLAASREAGFEVRDEARAFSESIDDYFRADVRFGLRVDSRRRRLSHTFFLDLQNVSNNDNVFAQRYNATTGNVGTVYQSGFFPDILYRVQF